MNKRSGALSDSGTYSRYEVSGRKLSSLEDGLKTPIAKRKNIDHNIIGIEMECSVVFTLAHLQKKLAGALLVVSDNPTTSDSHAVDENLEEKEEKGFKTAIKIALEVLVNL